DEREDHEGDEHFEQRKAGLTTARSVATAVAVNAARHSRTSSPRAHDQSSLLEDRDATGQPVDVDVVFAFAGTDGDTPAVRSAVGEETNRADAIVDDVALRGEELQIDSRRKRMLARVAIDAERPPVEIDDHTRVAASCERLASRDAQPCCDLARGALQFPGRH